MDDMRILRKLTKSDLLLNIFDEVGKTMSVEDVCSITGISNYNSLKALLCYIRKADHIPEENRVDVRIHDGQCIRAN